MFVFWKNKSLKFQANTIIQALPIRVIPEPVAIASSLKYTFSRGWAKNPLIDVEFAHDFLLKSRLFGFSLPKRCIAHRAEGLANARRQARRAAGARHERTLAAVACTPL
jgi:hypothetical protein